jgi:diguanylate cyclase (GGDEF)-like protein/PAS domain S-box-containing protein
MTALLPTSSNTFTPEPPRTISQPRGLIVLASALCVWLFTSPIMGTPFSLVLRFSYVLLAVLACELGSAYKQLKAARHGAEKALRTQEDRFQALVENSADGVILVSPDGTVLYSSPSAQRVLGYRSAELLGRDTMECIYPEDQEQVRTFLRKLSQRAGASVTTEFRCRQKGGAWRWIESTGTNLLEQPGIAAIVVNFRDIEARKRSEEQLRVLATTDPLTGLANYRRLIEDLDSELKRSDRTGRPFAMLLLDLDDLKRINDRFGHLVGSRALSRVAEVLRTHCRVIDTSARYGGDEFTIILPESDDAVARSVASRISQHLASDPEDPRISVSVGIAVYPNDGNTIELLLSAADRQLYEMKNVRHCTALQGAR